MVGVFSALPWKEHFHEVGNGPYRQHALWLPFNNFHETVIVVVSCQISKLCFKWDIVIFLRNYVVPLAWVLKSCS
jgi:hypothetical protein